MLPLGNTNTLTYDAGEARKSRWFRRNKLAVQDVPLAAAVAET